MFFKIAIFTCALIFSQLVKAESWYNISGFSYHTNTNTIHNQRNWGLGYETNEWGSRNWQFGAYKNSFWKNTFYVTTDLISYQISDRIKIRAIGGLVTGYKYAVEPMVFPVWTFTENHWGLDVLTIPSLGKTQGIYAVQFKVRF